MDARCFDCRFFVADCREHPSETQESDWDFGGGEGECRRRAPHLGDIVPQKDDQLWRTIGIWPRVLAALWCGEFEGCKPEQRPWVAPGENGNEG